MNSGKYSSINYCSGNEHEEAQPVVPNKIPKSTRFSPREWQGSHPSKFLRQCSMAPSESSLQSARCKNHVRNCQLMRNRSFVDLRSQLLRRILAEELSRRHFKTVGGVEDIGFQMPYSIPQTGSSSSARRDCRDCMMQAWGRS